MQRHVHIAFFQCGVLELDLLAAAGVEAQRGVQRDRLGQLAVIGCLGGAGSHLAQLAAGARQGDGLLGDLGAVKDIAIRNTQIVGGSGNGQGLFLHHVKYHVHRVVAALHGHGHAVEQTVCAAHQQPQGLFAAVAHAGPVRVDHKIRRAEPADGVAIAGELQVHGLVLGADDAQAPGGIGGGIIGIIHRHIIDGVGGAGLNNDGDHHPCNDGTQHRQCQPDAAVIQKIFLFADGRLCAIRLVRLVAHCCSSSPFWLIQFHSFFACSTQLSAVFFSTVDSLGIISSMRRVYRLWRSK